MFGDLAPSTTGVEGRMVDFISVERQRQSSSRTKTRTTRLLCTRTPPTYEDTARGTCTISKAIVPHPFFSSPPELPSRLCLAPTITIIIQPVHFDFDITSFVIVILCRKRWSPNSRIRIKSHTRDKRIVYLPPSVLQVQAPRLAIPNGMSSIAIVTNGSGRAVR